MRFELGNRCEGCVAEFMFLILCADKTAVIIDERLINFIISTYLFEVNLSNYNMCRYKAIYLFHIELGCFK